MAEEIEEGGAGAEQDAPRLTAWGFNTEALIGQIITASVPVKGVYALPGAPRAMIKADCVIVSADRIAAHERNDDVQLMVEVIGFPRTDGSEDYTRRQASLIGRVRTVMLSSDPYFHEHIIEAHQQREAAHRRASRTDPSLIPPLLEAISGFVRAYRESTQPPPEASPLPAAEPLAPAASASFDDYIEKYGYVNIYGAAQQAPAAPADPADPAASDLG